MKDKEMLDDRCWMLVRELLLASSIYHLTSNIRMKDENDSATVQLDCCKHAGGDLFGQRDEAGGGHIIQFPITVQSDPEDDP